MLIRSADAGFAHPVPSEVTPQALWASRRTALHALAMGATGLAAWAGRDARAQMAPPGVLSPLAAVPSALPGAQTMERPTAYRDATQYNNFYEFGTDKSDPARHAGALNTTPWTLEIEGLVNKPGRVALEDLMKWGPMQERIYRLRCVEGWSMVIPWVGYSLAELIRRVEPQGSARYVEFVTQLDAKAMPGVRSSVLSWPYVEALRLDEAMHPLTLLSF
ncbi:MAG: protein-methionine-sulfoxide reductase catalytic subunit MsrP, partial [Betaproteobacteria bacterium]|nr:protein-methionine-sulfoxide reductase catalytic subunit MsrP [Betaproteobacteria bacterium]